VHDNYNHGVVHLAPPAQDWAGMTSGLQQVLSRMPGTKDIGVKLEIVYRQPMTQHMRLVAGRYPAPPPPLSGPQRAAADVSGVLPFTSLFQVAVSALTARQFGLHPGSKVKVAGPAIATTGRESAITLDVTGIVVPDNPSSAFWTADATLLAPGLQEVSTAFGPGELWVGGVFSAPGSIDAMQRDFGVDGLTLQWELPMEFGSLGAQQAQPLADALTRLGAQAPTLPGGRRRARLGRADRRLGPGPAAHRVPGDSAGGGHGAVAGLRQPRGSRAYRAAARRPDGGDAPVG